MKINIKHLKEGLYHFDFITNRNSIDLVEDEVFINNIEVCGNLLFDGNRRDSDDPC